MKQPAPNPPSPAEVVRAQIALHQQRMQQYDNERALRHIMHRLQQMEAAAAQRTNEESRT